MRSLTIFVLIFVNQQDSYFTFLSISFWAQSEELIKALVFMWKIPCFGFYSLIESLFKTWLMVINACLLTFVFLKSDLLPFIGTNFNRLPLIICLIIRWARINFFVILILFYSNISFLHLLFCEIMSFRLHLLHLALHLNY